MRYFQATQNLVLPQKLQNGPGGTHVRLSPGEVVGIDDAACASESRFINGRLRGGDLVEVAAPEADSAPAKPAKGK